MEDTVIEGIIIMKCVSKVKVISEGSQLVLFAQDIFQLQIKLHIRYMWDVLGEMSHCQILSYVYDQGVTKCIRWISENVTVSVIRPGYASHVG